MWNPGRVVANFARSRPEAARPSAHGGATAGADLSDERSGGVRCRPPRSAAACIYRLSGICSESDKASKIHFQSSSGMQAESLDSKSC